MPLLSRLAIRLAMGYLLTGLALWILYTLDQTTDLLAANWIALRPVSIHFITIGWLTQLIFAVMYWMFPILSRQNPYGSPRLGWAALVCLNLGLVTRAIFEVGMTQGWGQDAGWGLVGAGLLQWGGISLWIALTWGRVKAKGGR
jgi:hypothetical protein